MKVDGSIANPIQGVSQQPARVRLPGQCTAQDNMLSNPVDGLTRRPPLEELGELFETEDSVQEYEFSIGNTDFIAFALDGDLKVFDTTGEEYTVNEESLPASGFADEDAFDYLDGGDLAFTTLEGITYVTNRSMTVEMLSTVKTYIETGAIVYCLGGQYSRTYSLKITWNNGSNTETVTYTAPNGATSGDIGKIAPEYIIGQLNTALLANANFIANFTATVASDVLYIKKTSSPADQVFSVVVTDADGGVYLYAINNEIKDAAKLPRFAPQDYIVKVTGTSNSATDDYYLKFACDPTDNGTIPAAGAGHGNKGKWVECVGFQVPFKLDWSTMPHLLVFDEGTGEFDFKFGEWADRQVGDEVSNEDPSFIGDTIEHVGSFQGRLAFLSGASFVTSRTDKPLDFWIQSATVQADTDPIDIQSTVEGVKKLYRMVPFNRDMVVFADKGQFIVFGRNSITPKNSSLVLTTTYEADLTATPVAAGKNIFFGIKYGNFAGIREFFTESSTDANDSRPITQHVLKYLIGTATSLSTTSNFDQLIVHTDADPKILYSYEYIWVEDKKAQSSWSRWLFNEDIQHSFFIGSVIFVVYKIGSTYYLGKINLDVQSDEGIDYQVKLDRKKTITAVDTTILNPYTDMPDLEDMIFIQGDGCPTPGLRVLVADSDDTTITFAKDMDGGDVICGTKYRSSWLPTIPSVKDSDRVRVGTGKLVISKFLVNYRDTGVIKARVFSRYRDDITTQFTGRIVGDPTTFVGEPAIVSGAWMVPFRHNANDAELEIFSDSHMPMTITDLEWIGQYTKRGKRITSGAT